MIQTAREPFSSLYCRKYGQQWAWVTSTCGYRNGEKRQYLFFSVVVLDILRSLCTNAVSSPCTYADKTESIAFMYMATKSPFFVTASMSLRWSVQIHVHESWTLNGISIIQTDITKVLTFSKLTKSESYRLHIVTVSRSENISFKPKCFCCLNITTDGIWTLDTDSEATTFLQLQHGL